MIIIFLIYFNKYYNFNLGLFVILLIYEKELNDKFLVKII